MGVVCKQTYAQTTARPVGSIDGCGVQTNICSNNSKTSRMKLNCGTAIDDVVLGIRLQNLYKNYYNVRRMAKQVTRVSRHVKVMIIGQSIIGILFSQYTCFLF